MSRSETLYDAIIVAAGNGNRFGGTIPKQYYQLNGMAVIRHSVQAFQAHPLIGRVILVIHKDHQNYITNLFSAVEMAELTIVTGADTRSQSVLNGLKALGDAPPKSVLIHDGARPLVTATLITDICTALQSASAVIPVTEITDTIKTVRHKQTVTTLDRNDLRAVQTPTGFSYSKLIELIGNNTDPELTEESCLFEQAGIKVQYIAGDNRNIKITRPEDLLIAASLQAQQKDSPGENTPHRLWL